jgi:hypothetical protein
MAEKSVVGFADLLLEAPLATQPRVANRLPFDGFELDVRAGELRKHGVRVRLRAAPAGARDPARTCGRLGDSGGAAEPNVARRYICRFRPQPAQRDCSHPVGAGRLGGDPALH